MQSQPSHNQTTREFLRFAHERGVLSQDWLQRIEAVGKESGEPATALLAKLGVLPEERIADLLSEFLGAQRAQQVTPLTAGPLGLNEDFLRASRVVPYRDAEQRLCVAACDALEPFPVAALEYALEERPVLTIATRSQIDALFGRQTEAVPTDARATDSEQLRDLVSDAPVIRAVQRIITTAYDQRASDIHFEPSETGLRVRARIDGLLQDIEILGSEVSEAVVSRIKVMAQLNIAEHRLPQDGRIRISLHGRDTDFRVATTPTHYGEGVVLRILDRRDVSLDLAALGIHPQALDIINRAIVQPHGIVLVTGPTGSGKTTTLYAALRALNASTRKILTVEDPIEYTLEGVNHVQVKPQIGLTFAHALRSFLRQDPDVMMVGEIRDAETARIAVQAAMTGHLVLSTVHTNSAAGAVTRLLDMGIEPYLLASTLNAVVGQRLVRKLCERCRQPVSDVAKALRSWKIDEAPRTATYHEARGCEHCRNSGYRGRTAVNEALEVGDDIRRGILDRLDEKALERTAVVAGMRTLIVDGLDKAAQGITTVDEVARAIREN